MCASTGPGTSSSPGKYPRYWKDFSHVTSASMFGSAVVLSRAHSTSSAGGTNTPAISRADIVRLNRG
jgi:hypothetical protein